MKALMIILLIFFATIQKCNHSEKSLSFTCDQFVQTIFNVDCFYIPKPGQINLTGIDTITILDKNGYLNSFNCQSEGEFFVDTVLLNKGSDYTWSDLDVNIRQIRRKIYCIKKDDEIPIRIRSFRATLEDHKDPKYKCYFIMEEIKMNGDSLYIHMEKLITNHRIGLTYIKRNNEFELVDKLIGQY